MNVNFYKSGDGDLVFTVGYENAEEMAVLEEAARQSYSFRNPAICPHGHLMFHLEKESLCKPQGEASPKLDKAGK